jgi:addiction module HigA family antidote
MGTRANRDDRRPGPSRKLKPVHPGEVLRLDFLEPMGVTAYRLAKEIGVSQQQIGRVLAGARGVSGDLALRLARFFGTSATVWMNLQAQYDLDAAEEKSGKEIEKRVRPFKAA